MPAPYVQAGYYWIPRLYGQDQETGTYADLPAGGWQWISDQDPATIPFQPATGLGQRALHLPSWFPRQVYFIGCEVAAGSNTPSGNTNEISCWVDPGGTFFTSGNPNGAEGGSNFTKVINLFSWVYTGGDVRAEFKIKPPILLDRDVGDLLGVKLGSSQEQVWIYVGFRFLVANPHSTLP